MISFKTISKMDKTEIKKAKLDDIEALQLISRQTFLETFAHSNTEDDMEKYLNESFSIDRQINELNNPGSEYYLATLHNKVIGYLKLNLGQAQTELKDQKALEIERIYVLQEFHGKRIGQMLYETAPSIAKKIKSEFIWLGVCENNLRAINFYSKNGFIAFDKHTFKLGNDMQTDIMMKLKIN